MGTQTPLASFLTCNRASPGASFDGVNWSQVGNNQLRYFWRGGAKRLLREVKRTNSLRNNSMQGASVKTTPTELVTNGDFALDPINASQNTTQNGWQWSISGGTATAVYASGAVQLTGDGTNSARLTQSITTVVGLTYTVTFDVSGVACNLFVGTTKGASNLLSATATVGTSRQFQFTATTTTSWIYFWDASAATTTIDNVSVKAEMVVNGMFTLDPINASQNATQNGWQWSISGGTATVIYGSGAVTLTGDGTNSGRLMQSITTVVGRTYTITVDVATNACPLFVGTTKGASNLLDATIPVGTAQKVQFTATSTTSWLYFWRSTATPTVIDNVFVEDAGAFPNSNWYYAITAGVTGIVRDVVGLGTDSGMEYMDVRLYGTPSGTGNYWIGFDSTGIEAATYGQTFALSEFQSLVAGSMTGITAKAFGLDEYNSGGTFVAGGSGTVASPTSSGLSGQRVSFVRTLTNPATAYVAPWERYSYTSGVAFDFTVRLSWPQNENCSNVNASVASAAVVSGGTGYTVGDVLTVVGGTLASGGAAATLTVATAPGGVIGSVTVSNAGAYTALAGAGAASVSVTGGTGTGATFTLTPTNNASKGYATSPIRTTGSAVDREADIYSVTGNLPTGIQGLSAYTVFGKVYHLAQFEVDYIISLEGASPNERISLEMDASNQFKAKVMSGGVDQYNAASPVAAAAGVHKFSIACTTNDARSCFDGTLQTADTSIVMPTGINKMYVGSLSDGSGGTCEIELGAVWASRRTDSAQQAL